MGITANTIASSIGRPVIMFANVCNQSRTFDKSLMDDSARIIQAHGGSVVIAVHPGFYFQSKLNPLVIAGSSSKQGKASLNEKYEEFRLRFEQFLSSVRVPTFLFIEKQKGLEPYKWVFDFARPPLTLVVETHKDSSLPWVVDEKMPAALSWVWTASTMRFDLGVRQAQFTGEYYLLDKDGPSGCVHSAYLGLETHIAGNIDMDLTFPNSPRKAQI